MTWIIEPGAHRGHVVFAGEPKLIRWLALLIVWTAALALPAVAAPAFAPEPPCPMESVVGAAGHQAMDCCDHGKGTPDQPAPCKPGMACFATAAALPATTVEIAVVRFDRIDPPAAPARALPSRPPDRTLRPPILV
ncbi:MAG: hypothetical protein ACOY4K_05910 [Pseudomonadota bacterium]